GGFQQWGWLMMFYSISLLISAAYSLRTMGRLFTGPIKPRMQSITDLQAYEMIGAGALVGCILLFGLLPALWIELSTATIDRMLLVIGERLP
ncbi:MAG: hypothetical protein RL563_2082, partial [Pseudomonadota bacterium]